MRIKSELADVCVFLSFVFVFLHAMCSMGFVPKIKLMYV